ncbi:MAG TPA: hypothetical protein VER33_03635 [Polyangiaceae bacterium]|nr:hypothetical protein [Polyangiaceae bacterium]
MTNRWQVLLPLLWVGALTPGCSDDSADELPDHASVADVVFVGGTNDEALIRLLAAKPLADPEHALEFDVPTAGEALPRDVPSTFVWHLPAAASLPARGAPPPSTDGPAVLRRVTRELKALLRPLGVAHAHGAPFNGTGFFLVFASPEEPELLRVFTSSTSYTPDEVAFGKLTATAAPLELTATSAIFEDNQLVEGGGPFEGATLPFTLQ